MTLRTALSVRCEVCRERSRQHLYYRPRQRSSTDGLAEIAPHGSLTRLDGLNRDTRRRIIGAMKLASFAIVEAIRSRATTYESG
jgi:hypothetical protein